jgi:hypothetical protein
VPWLLCLILLYFQCSKLGRVIWQISAGLLEIIPEMRLARLVASISFR